jgi:hypothetical protein
MYSIIALSGFGVCFVVLPWLFGWNEVGPPADAVINAKLGSDGCFPVKEQKKSLAAAPGHYNVLLLARWSINGLCAVDSDRPVCSVVKQLMMNTSSEITTTVRGLWPVREGCGREDDDATTAVGHHWPQYCVAGAGYLNGTAFGLLAAASPPQEVCSTVQHWPLEFCDRLKQLQLKWPDVSTNAERSSRSAVAAAAAATLLSSAPQGGGVMTKAAAGGIAPPELGPNEPPPPIEVPKGSSKSGGLPSQQARAILKRSKASGGDSDGGSAVGATGNSHGANHLHHELDDHLTGETWATAWARHGSCSGLHASEYLEAALAANAALLALDDFETAAKTLGPEWPSADGTKGSHGNVLDRPYNLKELNKFFGGPYGAAFQCQQDEDGKYFLVSIKQCVRSSSGGGREIRGPNGEGGSYLPAVCPRWVMESSLGSCKPEGAVGASVWLGRLSEGR